MATYNRALDLMALAAHELRKGNVVNASTLLQRASVDPSLGHALRMVEATNEYAAAVEAKARQLVASRKIVAQEGHEDIQRHANEHRAVEHGLKDNVNAEFEDTDEDTMALLNQENANSLEDETEDDDAVPAEELSDEDEELPVSAKALAKALASVLKQKR